jgi:hypothetical protein
MAVEHGADLWWNGQPRKDDDWDRLVGRFVLAFGEIENIVTFALKALPADPIGDVAAELPFAQRMDLLAAVLAPHTTGPRADLLTALKEARAYARKRNVVAHNGISYSFFVDEDGGNVRIASSIRSARGNKIHEIQHAEMVRLVDVVNGLTSNLNNALLAVCEAEGIGAE